MKTRMVRTKREDHGAKDNYIAGSAAWGWGHRALRRPAVEELGDCWHVWVSGDPADGTDLPVGSH